MQGLGEKVFVGGEEELRKLVLHATNLSISLETTFLFLRHK